VKETTTADLAADLAAEPRPPAPTFIRQTELPRSEAFFFISQHKKMFRPRLLRIPRLSQSVLATATSQQAAGQPHLLPLAARQIIAQQQSRSQHTLPTLPKEAQLRNGVPDLLSAGTVELAWFEYQEMMLRKLNALAAGMLLLLLLVSNLCPFCIALF